MSEVIEASYSALKLLEIPDLANFIITYLSILKLDKETIKDFEQTNKLEKIPTFEMLSDHIKTQAKIAGRTFTIPTKPQAYCHLSNRFACKFCGAAHVIYQCSKFKTLEMAERVSFVKKERLCIVCLQTHAVGKCFSKRKCFTCGGSHNSIICESKKKQIGRAHV